MLLFKIIWLAGTAFGAFWQAAWGLCALRTGVATYYFHYEFQRGSQPFVYWMLVLARGAGLLVAIGFFAIGLRMPGG